MKIREPECVVIKRRGAEYVAKLLSGKTHQQQLKFWQKRTIDMLNKQELNKSKSISHSVKS